MSVGGQSVDALAQDRRQSGGGDRIHDVCPRSSVSAGKEDERTPDELVMPRSDTLRQIEQASAPIGGLKWRAAPEHAPAICREHACYRLQQRRLACAVGPDEAEHLAGLHGKCDIGERDLVPVALGQAGNLE